MATPRRKRITGRVMHEFKHGELRSGRGGKVKSRRQAIAIALEEAGASKYESGARNRRNLRRTEKKEAAGRTGQQEREGKSRVGAYRQRESHHVRERRAQDHRARTQGCNGPRPQARRQYASATLCQGQAPAYRGAFEDEQAAVGECAGDALKFGVPPAPDQARSIRAMPRSACFFRLNLAGVSVRTTSSVGRTLPSSRCPPRVVPSDSPSTT